MSTYVNELRKLRKSLGFTQIQAAKVLNISRRSYQNYEYEYGKENLNKIYDQILEELSKCKILDEEHGLLTLKQIKSISANILKKYPKVDCAYLFGSYSRNEATSKSDVDILLIGENFTLFDLSTVQVDLSEHLNKKVDVLTLSSILDNKFFLSEILTKGVRIYVKVCSQTKS